MDVIENSHHERVARSSTEVEQAPSERFIGERRGRSFHCVGTRAKRENRLCPARLCFIHQARVIERCWDIHRSYFLGCVFS